LRPELEMLLRLQKIDLKILTIKKELQEAPARFEALQESQAQKEQELTEMKEKLSTLQERRFEVEDELKMETERLRKSQKKLTLIKTEREYHAILKEIDEIKKANKSREDEILEAEEEIEKINNEIDAKNKEIKEVNAQLKSEEKTLSKKTKALEKEIARLTKERKKEEKDVQPALLSRYSFLKDKLGGLVVVSVINGVCAGCNMNIPPQLYNELLRDDKVYSCPTCQRFIYAESLDREDKS